MSKKQIVTQLLYAPWTLWCILWFVLCIAAFFPLLVLVVIVQNAYLIKIAHFVPHYLSKFLLTIWGVRVEIIGNEFVEPDRQIIYISNHRSYLDAFVASACIPNYTKFLGKAEIRSWPVLGYLMDKFYVGVQREDDADRQRSMVLMNEKLKTGASFFICPEGTCNTTSGLLKHFYTGAFRLAVQNNLPLVPLTFVNTAERFPRQGLMLRPGKVIVYWHAPIETGKLSEPEGVDILTKQAMDIIYKDLMLHHPSGSYIE